MLQYVIDLHLVFAIMLILYIFFFMHVDLFMMFASLLFMILFMFPGALQGPSNKSPSLR
jgi:hypothetical protein